MTKSDRSEEFLEPLGFVWDVNALVMYIEERWRKEQESKPINLKTKLSAALNKCPAPWINGICQQLGLPTKGRKKDKVAKIVQVLHSEDGLRSALGQLPPSSMEALAFIVREGGWVKYGRLSRRWGGEEGDGWWWADHPPTSTIGQLRTRGLVFVGRAGLEGRMYKVAVVPVDLRESLGKLLQSEELGAGRG